MSDMNLKDLIKNANDILGLPINWNNVSDDDNYQQLSACAKLVLNSLLGVWQVYDNTRINPEAYNLDYATLIYGILAEYAFVTGMFNEWKVWQAKFDKGVFKAENGKTRIIPIQ